MHKKYTESQWWYIKQKTQVIENTKHLHFNKANSKKYDVVIPGGEEEAY